MDATGDADREEQNVKLLSVGMGKYDGYQDVVIVAYWIPDDGSPPTARVIDVDLDAIRSVPADLVVPYHVSIHPRNT